MRRILNKTEESDQLSLDFKKLTKATAHCPDIIPVAVQNADTGELILLAYTNQQAFQLSMRSRKLILWSTSRNALWEKGKTSGETFDLIAAYVNCEQNSLLYRVRPRRGGICHTRNRQNQPRNCFYRQIDFDSLQLQNNDP